MDYDSEDERRQYEDEMYGGQLETDGEHDESESDAGELEAQIQFNTAWHQQDEEGGEVDVNGLFADHEASGNEEGQGNADEPITISDEEDQIQKGASTPKPKRKAVDSFQSSSDSEGEADGEGSTRKKQRVEVDDEATPRPKLRTIQFDPLATPKAAPTTFVGEDVVELEPPRPASARTFVRYFMEKRGFCQFCREEGHTLRECTKKESRCHGPCKAENGKSGIACIVHQGHGIPQWTVKGCGDDMDMILTESHCKPIISNFGAIDVEVRATLETIATNMEEAGGRFDQPSDMNSLTIKPTGDYLLSPPPPPSPRQRKPPSRNNSPDLRDRIEERRKSGGGPKGGGFDRERGFDFKAPDADRFEGYRARGTERRGDSYDYRNGEEGGSSRQSGSQGNGRSHNSSSSSRGAGRYDDQRNGRSGRQQQDDRRFDGYRRDDRREWDDEGSRGYGGGGSERRPKYNGGYNHGRSTAPSRR
ncbi:hypothetical protein HDV00_006129 [Rhizophlyctis rosea]|nr:hypothetical protein HDV00_006129 [Rhizophlyctis rosea]